MAFGSLYLLTIQKNKAQFKVFFGDGEELMTAHTQIRIEFL